MSENEWLECHPAQAEEYLTAWETKESREDFRTALLRMTIAQCMAGKKKDGRPFKLNDFLPDYCKRKAKPKTPEEQSDEIEKMFLEFVVK